MEISGQSIEVRMIPILESQESPFPNPPSSTIRFSSTGFSVAIYSTVARKDGVRRTYRNSDESSCSGLMTMFPPRDTRVFVEYLISQSEKWNERQLKASWSLELAPGRSNSSQTQFSQSGLYPPWRIQVDGVRRPVEAWVPVGGQLLGIGLQEDEQANVQWSLLEALGAVLGRF